MRAGAPPAGGRPTCVAPHGQVLVLLDVQHDLQAVARPALHGGAQRPALLGRVEHVALAVPGEHLKGETAREGRSFTIVHRRVLSPGTLFHFNTFFKSAVLFTVIKVVIFFFFACEFRRPNANFSALTFHFRPMKYKFTFRRQNVKYKNDILEPAGGSTPTGHMTQEACFGASGRRSTCPFGACVAAFSAPPSD